MFDPVAEGEAFVAGEGPGLAGGAGDAGDCADEREDDEDGGHGDGGGEGLGAVVEDLDDGDAGGGVEDVVDVADAEAECDEHGETEDGVADGGPNHGAGKDAGRVLEFFGHVCAGVWAEEAPEWCGNADERAETLVAPDAVVEELREDLFGWGVVTHDPEDD